RQGDRLERHFHSPRPGHLLPRDRSPHRAPGPGPSPLTLQCRAGLRREPPALNVVNECTAARFRPRCRGVGLGALVLLAACAPKTTPQPVSRAASESTDAGAGRQERPMTNSLEGLFDEPNEARSIALAPKAHAVFGGKLVEVG